MASRPSRTGRALPMSAPFSVHISARLLMLAKQGQTSNSTSWHRTTSMNRVEFSRANRRIVRHASDEVKAWAAHRLGTDFNEPCSAFGILDRKGTLVGAAIFNDFDQRN